VQPSLAASSASVMLTPSVAAPRPLSPAAGAIIANSNQPLTLIVANAVVTHGGTATYTFEVATDAAFGAKVFSKTGITEGGGGQTSLTVDQLAASSTFYWHVRADAGGTIGQFTAVRPFTIGPAVTVGAPALLTPVNGAVTAGWPTLSVSNASRSGPVGAITYRFEVGTSSTFSPAVVVATVSETPTQTNYAPPSTLAATPGAVYFWRVTALDSSNGITSTASEVRTFTYANQSAQAVLAAQEGLTLWPGQQPPGTTGNARMGPGWTLGQVRSFTGLNFTNPPIEALQLFDLLDRGMDPDGAIGWMQTHGYPTTAVWYANVAAIGLQFQYMALVAGAWELVLRVGA